MRGFVFAVMFNVTTDQHQHHHPWLPYALFFLVRQKKTLLLFFKIWTVVREIYTIETTASSAFSKICLLPGIVRRVQSNRFLLFFFISIYVEKCAVAIDSIQQCICRDGKSHAQNLCNILSTLFQCSITMFLSIICDRFSCLSHHTYDYYSVGSLDVDLRIPS